MTSSLRRAAAFALVATLSLLSPLLDAATAVPFAAVAVVALVVTDGPVFELFARPIDRREGRLRGLAGFSIAATALALMVTLLDMPGQVFVASVLLLAYGNLAQQVVRRRWPGAFASTIAFTAGGFLAAFVGQFVVLSLANASAQPSDVGFLAASGALLAALLRSVLYGRDDPLVLFSVAMLLWLLEGLAVSVSPLDVFGALFVTAVFGYLSWALDTASIPGMLTGILLGLLTIVLGGYGWFTVLIVFFGVGGLATQFRYGEKQARGVAEENDGARGSGNVLGNATVALVAVLAFAASPKLQVGSEVFLYAFVGSIATALSDTLSSEIGGVFDDPRLITTMQRVDPGTDGGVTWQGEVAGLGGAILIALLALFLFGEVGLPGAVVVVAAGVGGMTADSLFGATIEGSYVGNQGVNFLATLTGALIGGGLAVLVGLGALTP